MECRKCETDLIGVRVVDSETEQREAAHKSDEGSGAASSEGAPISLVRVCEECGTENVPQARKCKQCGEDISDILPTPSGQAVEKPFAYRLTTIDGSYSAIMDKPFSVVGREAELKEYLSSKIFARKRNSF